MVIKFCIIGSPVLLSIYNAVEGMLCFNKTLGFSLHNFSLQRAAYPNLLPVDIQMHNKIYSG